MTYTASNTAPEVLKGLQRLDVDQQLALFYFIYKEMGKSVTPAAPDASTVSPQIAEGLYNQVKGMPHETQLQVQRDLINHVDNQISREYGALSDTTKLLFWYRLSQGMDANEIIPLPPGFKLAQQAEELLNQIKSLEFQQQITLFRDYVAPMGVDPTASGRAVIE